MKKMKRGLSLFVVLATILWSTGLTGLGFLAAPAAMAGDAMVIINEFVSNSVPGSDEWVELLNTTDAAIDLSGWELSHWKNPDKVSMSEDSLISLSGTLPAHGILVFASKNKLNDVGDAVTLYNGAISPENLIGRVSYGTQLIDDTPDVSAPASGQSASYSSGVWSVGTPTKGWFNDTTGGAPAWSTITASFCANPAGPCAIGVIASNLVSAGDPSAIADLYFENIGLGKIQFSGTLNMTDEDTVSTLQSIGEKLDMAQGVIEFSPELTSALKDAGATLTMSGLPEGQVYGLADIIVKDDEGDVLNLGDEGYPSLGLVSSAAGVLTFTTDHFTTFEVPTNVLVTSIIVSGAGDATTIETNAGTLQMSASVLPVDATNQAVAWSVTADTGGASIDEAGLLTAMADGTVTVRATAQDGSDVFGELIIKISNQVAPDSTAPVTTDDAPAGWQSAAFTVNLTCTDDDSGCAGTYYSIDGGETQTGTTITIDTDGDHAIAYYSIDNNGNTEAVKGSDGSIRAQLDMSDPTTALESPAEHSYLKDTVTLVASASDGLSGVNKVEFWHASVASVKIGEGTLNPADGSYAIDFDSTSVSNGNHNFWTVAYDNVGNQTTGSQVQLNVDNTDPSGAIESPTASSVLKGRAQISVSGRDGGSGIDKVEVYYDDTDHLIGNGEPADGGLYNVNWETTGATDGAHNLFAKIYDGAGNVGTTASVGVVVDNTGPVISVNGDNPATAYIGEEYVDAGATAIDAIDGDISEDISVSGLPIDTSAAGSFTVTYNASDHAGNTATAETRTVNVVSRDTTPPSVVSAIATGDKTVEITFDEELMNDSDGHHPTANDFRIYHNNSDTDGGTPISIESVSYADKVVTLTLSETINLGDSPVYQVWPRLSTIMDLAGNEITGVLSGDITDGMAPTAVITPSFIVADVGAEITFSATSSVDNFWGINYYDWSFGDDSRNTEGNDASTATHSYGREGIYTVDLTVYDNVEIGQSATTSAQVLVGSAVFSPDSDLDVEFTKLPGGQYEFNAVQTAAAAGSTSGFRVGNLNYNITSSLVNGTFEVSLTFHYADANNDGVVDGTEINESDLNVYYWDGSAWVAVASPVRDGTLNTITVTVDHFTGFSLLSVAPAAPAPASGGGGGGGGMVYNDAPQPPFVFLINNNEASTANRQVNLTINGGSSARRMAISNTSDFINVAQEDYATTKTWTLTEGVGEKTVYIKFYSQNGYASSVVSDAIALTESAVVLNNTGLAPQVLGVKIVKYPNGVLLRNQTTGQIYFIISAAKKYIPDLKTLATYRGRKMINVSQEILDAYPDYTGQVLGVKVYPNGTLLRNKVTHQIYVILDGYKRYIATLEELKTYRGRRMYNVAASVIDGYPDQP